MSRPLIGLSTYREQARWGVWDDVTADLLPAAYARSVEAAGGVPVLVPPLAASEDAAVVVARLDGLIIAGGADVDPGRYARAAHTRTAGWRADRDASEFALLDVAAERGVPTLGICRGMQVMAVRAGGTLDQHTPEITGDESHSPGGDVYGDIEVETVPGSQLGSLIGERLTVTCHHHQSVRTHPGFVPAAYAKDGLLEAIEDPDRPFWLAVQWHPETQADAGLFGGLVSAAAL